MLTQAQTDAQTASVRLVAASRLPSEPVSGSSATPLANQPPGRYPIVGRPEGSTADGGSAGCGHPIAPARNPSRVPGAHRLEHRARRLRGSIGKIDGETGPAQPLRTPVLDRAAVGLYEHGDESQADARAGNGGVVAVGPALEPVPDQDLVA